MSEIGTDGGFTIRGLSGSCFTDGGSKEPGFSGCFSSTIFKVSARPSLSFTSPGTLAFTVPGAFLLFRVDERAREELVCDSGSEVDLVELGDILQPIGFGFEFLSVRARDALSGRLKSPYQSCNQRICHDVDCICCRAAPPNSCLACVDWCLHRSSKCTE